MKTIASCIINIRPCTKLHSIKHSNVFIFISLFFHSIHGSNLRNASNWYRDTCFMIYNVTWYVFMSLKIHYKWLFYSLPPWNIWIFQQDCLLRFPPQRAQSKAKNMSRAANAGIGHHTPSIRTWVMSALDLNALSLWDGKSRYKRGSVWGNVLIPFLIVSSPKDRIWFCSYLFRNCIAEPVSPRHMTHFQVKQVIKREAGHTCGNVRWSRQKGMVGFCRCDWRRLAGRLWLLAPCRRLQTSGSGNSLWGEHVIGKNVSLPVWTSGRDTGLCMCVRWRASTHVRTHTHTRTHSAGEEKPWFDLDVKKQKRHCFKLHDMQLNGRIPWWWK